VNLIQVTPYQPNWLCLIIIFCLQIGEAQDHDYIQYTTKDGLPTNYVYGVIEDDDGYIWAYTENGMSKFDGYTFQNLSTRDGLPGNDVVYSMKDEAGRLWLYTYRNLPAFIQNDSIHIIYNHTGVPIVVDKGKVVYSCEDGNVITYGNEGIEILQDNIIDSTILSNESGSFQLDSVKQLPSDVQAYSLLNERSAYICIRNDSVYYYTMVNYAFHFRFLDAYCYYFPDSRMVYWRGEQGSKKFPLKAGIELRRVNSVSVRYLAFEEKCLFSYNSEQFILLDFEKEESRLIDISDVKSKINGANLTLLDTSFFIGTSFGYREYNFDGRMIEELELRDLGNNYLFRRSYKDSKGNVWIGSREGGLFFIPKRKRATKLLSSSKSSDKAFEQLIATNDDQLMGITDNSGVYLIQQDTLINILPPDKEIRFRSATNTPFGIIMSSSHKSYLIKNKGNAFSFHDIHDYFKILVSGNDSRRFENPNHFLNNYLSMSYNQEEQVLYAVRPGVILIVDFLNEKTVSKSYFRHSSFSSIYYHPDQKRLYSGGLKNLDYFESQDAIPLLDEAYGLNNISALYSSGQNLWVGTESDGLFFYNFSNKKLTQVSSANMIRKIRLATDSTLLVASNEGVLHIHKNKLTSPLIYQYTFNDGLRSNEIQDVYYNDNQTIYVATSEGMHLLDMNSVEKNVENNSDLKIVNVKANKRKIAASPNLELVHTDNTIDISYQLLSYESNGEVLYYTRLEPLENDWQESNNTNVNYLSLPPDEYTFHLKAKDVYGNEVTLAPFQFTIKKAYWQTAWFKSLIALIGIALLIGIIRYRDQKKRTQLNKEKEVNRRMAELELSALKAQMNPHFVFNALGAIQYFIQTNDVEAADNYLTRFARLMRKYLDSSKEKMVSLKDEIELLSIYTDLEKMRFEDLFTTEIEIDSDIQTEDTFLPSMIIQPFVENAVNHGLPMRKDKKGILKIKITKSNNVLLCHITDNGIGRQQAQKLKWKGHQSKGLAIVTEKLNTLRSSGLADVIVDINDLNPTDKTYPGTQVSVKIKNLEDEFI